MRRNASSYRNADGLLRLSSTIVRRTGSRARTSLVAVRPGPRQADNGDRPRGRSNSEAKRLIRFRMAYDRVQERRRAVAVARHFRESEGLSIAQIAQRLDRSSATINAYFYDPS